MESEIYSTLKKYYGYNEFRPLQKEIVLDVLNKKDVFVLMPTGGGKSLCYQLPALLMKMGLTIVVSPLIALMKDQVDGLIQNGVQAEVFNSTLTSVEKARVQKKLENNEVSILYLAPERLMQEEFLVFLKSLPISLFAIDEAHCISEWGHDFRPEYRKLSNLKKIFPDVPIIALTATATERVATDIISQLELKDAKKYKASFNRANIFYQVQEKQDQYEQIINFINSHAGTSGIIYCHSRDNVETLTKVLKHQNIESLPYHAGLPDSTRKKNQEKFIKDEVSIMVATIAFGMGIDKPNIRYVIHADLPSNLERYYQETGRAGRDGLDSECLLLFSLGDREKIKFFINQKTDFEEQKIANIQLNTMIKFAQTSNCRRAELLEYFAEKFPEKNCKSCDNCVSPKERFDGTELAQKILSCVFRCNERFGAKYISEVLIGKASAQIIQNNHQSLSTFAIIENYTSPQIKTFIQELINNEFLIQTVGQYPILKLTPKGWLVLKNKLKVTFTKLDDKKITSTRSIGKLKRKVESEKYDQTLFEKLRKLRKTLADEQNLPPYIIFSDATLKEMATKIPKTKSEFKKIKGVGEQKLEKYADIFLKEIN